MYIYYKIQSSIHIYWQLKECYSIIILQIIFLVHSATDVLVNMLQNVAFVSDKNIPVAFRPVFCSVVF